MAKKTSRTISPPNVLGIRFTDQLSGQSDELTVELEDSRRELARAWYRVKRDTLSLALGMVGAPLRPCGTFSIDEIELSGPPDTVSLRWLSASVDQRAAHQELPGI